MPILAEEGGGPVKAPGKPQTVASVTAIIKAAEAAATTPPKPSVIQQIVQFVTPVVSPVVSFADSAIDKLGHEAAVALSGLHGLITRVVADLRGYINDTKNWLLSHVGGLIADARDEAKALFGDATHEAAHLFDVAHDELTHITGPFTSELHRIENTLGKDLLKAENIARETADTVVRDVLKPVEHFVADSENWFERHWHLYAHDIEGFIHDSENWFERHFNQYMHDVEDFIHDPIGWLEHNWKHAAGDLLQWLDPAPMKLLSLLPDVFGWLEWLARNPFSDLKLIGNALRDPANYTAANKNLKDNRATLAAAVVAKAHELSRR